MDRPQFSTVIPTYNRRQTIGRAVESALGQSLPPAQIIVVDDGSTDGTEAIVKQFGLPVEYVWQENAGVPCARNFGVDKACCPWIAFLDSDDYWHKDHLMRMADAIMATGGRAQFYFADMQLSGNNWTGSLWEAAGFGIDGAHQLIDDATGWAMLKRQPMMLQASVFCREHFLQVGGLYEKLPMRDDTHLFYKMSFGGAACAVAYCGAQMTSDDDSGGRLTTTLGEKTMKFWLCSALMYEDLLVSFPMLGVAHRVALSRYLVLSYSRVLLLAWRQRRPIALVYRFGKGFFSHPLCMLRAVAWALAGLLKGREGG